MSLSTRRMGWERKSHGLGVPHHHPDGEPVAYPVQDAMSHCSCRFHHPESEPDLSCYSMEWSLWKGSNCSWWRVRWWKIRSIHTGRKTPVLFFPFSASEPDFRLPGTLHILCHHYHLPAHPAGSQISSQPPLPPLLLLQFLLLSIWAALCLPHTASEESREGERGANLTR